MRVPLRFLGFIILLAAQSGIAASSTNGIGLPPNWYPESEEEGPVLVPEGKKYTEIADIVVSQGSAEHGQGLTVRFKQAGEIVLTNKKNPRVLEPESRKRSFVLRFRLRTETDYRTGHHSSCWIRMQTPSGIGAMVTFPRKRFRYLDDSRLVGAVFELDKDEMIGNIQFRLMSTAPGLAVELNEPYFTEVTDLPAPEVARVLNGATLDSPEKLPFREAFVDRTPPVKGNRVWNSGFEAAADGAWGYPARRMEPGDFSLENPHSGRFALKLAEKPLMHMPVALTMYKPHTFSVWVRPDDASKKSSLILTMHTWKGEYEYSKKHEVQGAEWQRVAVSEGLMPVPSGRYWFQIRGSNVVIDDIQVEEGELSPYGPRGGVEAGLSMAAKAFVYDWGQRPPLQIHFANSTATALHTTAEVRVWDIWGKVVFSRSLQVDLEPGDALVHTVNLPDALRGAFCADLFAGGNVLAERVFSVLPKTEGHCGRRVHARRSLEFQRLQPLGRPAHGNPLDPLSRRLDQNLQNVSCQSEAGRVAMERAAGRIGGAGRRRPHGRKARHQDSRASGRTAGMGRRGPRQGPVSRMLSRGLGCLAPICR